MMNAILKEKLYAGNPHIRFCEEIVASEKPRRGSLFCKLTMLKSLFAVTMVAVGLTTNATPTTESDFEFDRTTGVITRYKGAGDAVEIPTTIGGVSVTAIGDWAFGSSTIKSIEIPASVTAIGEAAFSSCNELMSFWVASDNPAYASINRLLCSKDGKTVVAGVNGDVVIPSSVTAIGEYAFGFYVCVTSVTFEDGSQLTKIGDDAFIEASVRSIEIPTSVTEIGTYAFYEASLESVTFAADSQLASIGDGAFLECDMLTSVTIPASVTNIGVMAFGGCSKLMCFSVASDNPAYASINRLLCSKDGKTLVAGVNGDVVIPAGVISIGDYAFYECFGLTSVTIPPSVTNIGEGAFDRCIWLTSVVIPPSVTSIGHWAFYGCELKTVVVDLGDVDRVKGLLKDSRFDVSGVTFVEKRLDIDPDPTDPSVDPDDHEQREDPDVRFSRFDYVGKYDGEAHTIDTNALKAAYEAALGAGVACMYSRARDGVWSAEPLTLKDVGVTSFWYKVTSANYSDIVKPCKVAITNRCVTLTSGNGEWAYDGNAHSNLTVTVSGDGFVSGEGVTTNGFATITDVGSVPNSFAYTFLPETLAANYAVTCVTGTLTVVKGDLPPGDDPDPADPSVDPDDPEQREDPDIRFSKFDYVGKYDGEYHTIDTNALKQAYEAVLGAGMTVWYAEGDGEGAVVTQWTETAPVFKDAGVTSFRYKVTSANYADIVKPCKVSITSRSVTFTSGSATFRYDGSPHSCAMVDVGGDGFVEGEGVDFSGFAQVTDPREYPNTFQYAFKGNTLSRNYAVTIVNGVLVIESPYEANKFIKIRSEWDPADRNRDAVALVCDLVADGVAYTQLVLNAENGWSADVEAPSCSGVEEVDYQLIVHEHTRVITEVTSYGMKPFKEVHLAGRVVTRQGYRVLSGMIAAVRNTTEILTEYGWKEVRRIDLSDSVATDRKNEGVFFWLSNKVLPEMGDVTYSKSTEGASVPVPNDWLGWCAGDFGKDYAEMVDAIGNNGCPVWKSYVMGLDPNDEHSRFKVWVNFDYRGNPLIRWSPDMRDAVPARIYTVYGKRKLKDPEWTVVTDDNISQFRFFRVTVELSADK